MATLAVGVNATEELWTVSESIPDGLRYFTVGDEIVEVTADFPAQVYAPTGLTTAPKIRVDRGAAGSTAAAHLSGVTLTPIYSPSVGGGPGGALTVTDGQTSVEATTLLLPAATVSEPDPGTAEMTVQKDFYAQDADPGAVGGGSVWKDTSVDALGIWTTRNVGNTVWEPEVAVQIIDGTDISVHSVTVGAAVSHSETAAFLVDLSLTSQTGIAVLQVTDLASSISQISVEPEAIELQSGDGLTSSSILVQPASISMAGLPTVDPEVVGQLWNDAGTLKISAGP